MNKKVAPMTTSSTTTTTTKGKTVDLSKKTANFPKWMWIFKPTENEQNINE